MRRLNFGCGSIQPAGWENVDREDFGQPHLGSTSLFDDNTFDIIVAHCVCSSPNTMMLPPCWATCTAS
jgi:hypothetical protein